MFDEYTNLVADIDSLAARLTKRYRPHLVCRAGCSGCCGHDLSAFEVEADTVRTALQALPAELRQRLAKQAREVQERNAKGELVACPLLVNNRCLIYEARPIICRTQGLPLLYRAEDGNPEVDYCPLNFTQPGAKQDLDANHLLQLDEINFNLAITNLNYCRSLGLMPSESGKRKPMSAIILEAEEPPDDTNLQ
jgi:Fe-S-cluster containining protein